MHRSHFKQDVKPISEFRANAAALIDHVRNRKRALILTQRGRSAAVVLDVDEYEDILDELELLRDVRTALEQEEKGELVSHDKVKKEVRRVLR